MSTVKIGPAFFKKEFNDYDNWRWAYVREAAQNCLDAPGATRVDFEINTVDGNTVVSFQNDGAPMNEDIIINKLFALGESGKNFVGGVGGFGKAKVLLYLAHESYYITSGDFIVSGSGGDFDLIESESHFAGTRSVVVMNGDHTYSLQDMLRKLCRYAQVPAVITLNGEVLDCNHNKGTRRRDLGFGVVYTSKREENMMVVRIGGLPMFTTYASVNRLVTVELVGNSGEIMTSNRDGLLSPSRGELSSFVTELAVDKKSALRPNQPRYMHFADRKLCHSQLNKIIDARDLVGLDVAIDQQESNVTVSTVGYNSPNPISSLAVTSTNSHVSSASVQDCSPIASKKSVSLGCDFVLKNETDLVVPNYYRPDSDEFSQYSKKLIRSWGRIMIELHRLFNRTSEFSIGFVFDKDCEAQHETHPSFGRIYYINPAEIIEQKSTASKSFKKRFLLTERDRLIAIATHEFIHGFDGYKWHDEQFAGMLTDLFGKVMKERKRFNWCFGK